MSTVHVRPPSSRKPGKTGRAKTGKQEVQSWLFRYRDQLWPFWAMLVVFLIQRIANPYPWSWAWLATAWVLFGVVLVVWGNNRLTRLDREVERYYAGSVCLAAALWSTWAWTGGLRPFLSLPLLTCLVAIPWWRHRRTRASVPIKFGKGLRGRPRAEAEGRSREIVNGWDVTCRSGKIQGTSLAGLEFEASHVNGLISSMSVDVVLRSGLSIRDLSFPGRQAALESAFDAPENSLRVEPRGKGKRTREVRLRFLLEDPNEDDLGAPEDDPDEEEIILGRFETGPNVIFDDEVHSGIFGQSGAGKSGIVSLIVRKLRRRPNWALVGVDLKPGATELGPWEGSFYFLADTPAKARIAFEALILGMEERGAEMRRRGWRSWRPTPAEPNVALIIDEVQELRRHGLMKYLEVLAGLARAYGFRLYVATQYPIDRNIPSTVVEQLKQIIGLKVANDKADRVIFGEMATRTGWTPSKLKDLAGMFLIRSRKYRRPTPARAFFMDEEDVDRENQSGPRSAVQIDARTARGFILAQPPRVELEEPEDVDQDQAVVEAIVVHDSADPRTAILAALRAGASNPNAVERETGIPRTTVRRLLEEMEGDGLVRQERPPGRSRAVWRAV